MPISRSAHDVTPLSEERVAELARRLDPEQFRVTQKAGTEAPFCGNLLDNKMDGTYVCVVCGLPLFSSHHKFDSGTGWPSFFTPYDVDHVTTVSDQSHGMVRTEINCARCRAHLGHVFEDGPAPTRLRFCLNSASLDFVEEGTPWPEGGTPIETATAYFAGGCFWGIEHFFQKGPGVVNAVSGFMQGDPDTPAYEQVRDGSTGHAETVEVVFDPARISYRTLLEAFFRMHDPTELDRQGPDVGSQYRSGIWTLDDEQGAQAHAYIAELTEQGAYDGRAIVTHVEEARRFWPADAHHQDYVERTGEACHVTNPWT